MNAAIQSVRNTLRPIARYLLVIGVIAVISLLFPNHARFEYQFSEGQVWQYDNLVADFDFPILKPDEQIQSELNELESDFSPYYRLDPLVEPQVKKTFEKRFENQLEAATREGQFADVIQRPRRYRNYIKDFLTNIYGRGIIQLAPQHKDRGNDFVINLVRGNVTQRRTLGSLPNAAQAEELLTDSLPYSQLKEAEFLLYVVEGLLRPNIFFDDTLTAKFKKDLLSSVSKTSGMVKKGELIVTKGSVITPRIYQKLISYRSGYKQEVANSQTTLGIFIGYLLLTSLIIIAFLMYLRSYLQEILEDLPKLSFIMMWFVIFAWLTYAVENTTSLSAYLVPFCIVPIVVKSFFTDRLAFFTHIVIVLIASFLSTLGYEFTFLQILAGIVAVLTTADARNWNKFFIAILFIFLTYVLGYIGLTLIIKGDITDVDLTMIGYLFLNVILTLLAFPLIPLMGRVFGFTTAISLVELSDLNRPLLQELAMKAPGTLQHSLQVGNLAEAAARAIGADQLLVKVGALYHDIGKTQHPEYFIENQGEKNPHNQMDNIDSARIIIGHVTAGVELAKKSRLPKSLINFILTHHGTTRVEYFYRNFIKENPDQPVDESAFRYPGPKPVTKEEALLMLADSLEAASKSLKNPTSQDIDNLVNKIINYKIKNGQFEHATLTFAELQKSKEVFRKMLRSILHVRVEYPEDESAEKE